MVMIFCLWLEPSTVDVVDRIKTIRKTCKVMLKEYDIEVMHLMGLMNMDVDG